MVESALDIVTAEELVRFDLGTVEIDRKTYTIKTGYEGTGMYIWYGGEIKGKLRRYCYGHMTLYYQHFDWGYAKAWCVERYDHRCANCGMHEDDIPPVGVGDYSSRSGMEVHHIIPLNGESREFTVYNLPWNLIALCHDCHLEVHAVMRGISTGAKLTNFDRAVNKGQLVLAGFK